MATKKSKREETQRLNKRQLRIIQLRKKLNTPDPNAVSVFTKYKIITYIFVIVFPPYALYRLWTKNSTFNTQEKIIQTMVSIVYMLFLIVNIVGG